MPLSQDIGGAVDPVTQKAIFTNGQWGYYSAGTSTTAVFDSGVLSSTTENDASSGRSSDEFGVSLQQNTSAVIGNSARMYTAINQFQLNQLPLFTAKVRFDSIANVRQVCGLCLSNGAAGNDQLGGNGIALQYVSTRDANFQFAVNDGVTFTLVDTGIPIDANIHFAQIDVISAAEVSMRLLNANFVIQAETSIVADLPAAATGLRIFSGCATLAAAVATISQFYGSILLRNG